MTTPRERTMTGGRPTRRAALAGMLAAAGGLAAAGCRPFGGADKAPTPDEVIRERVLAGKHTLLAGYAATLERHPALRGRLAPLQAEHQAHVTALNGTLTPSPTTAATPAATAAAVPATPGAALARLATAEREAAAARVQDLAGASPRLARVLAAMGGCEASHAALLGGS